MAKKTVYFCDTETHDLYGEICMFQYIDKKSKKATIVEYPDLKWLRKFVRNNHTVWYNASYDLGTINNQTGKSLGLKYTFDDLFYAGRSAYPAFPAYSLDIFHDRLGMKYYDPNLDKRKMQKSFTTAIAKKARKATPEQLAYGEADVLTLRDLYNNKKFKKVYKKNKAYALDIESLKYSLIYQRNGIPVDRIALAEERAKLVDTLAENKRLLDGLNPNSPKQCKEALGTTSTDKDTLVRLIGEGNKLAKLIFDQRRLIKADGMLKSWEHERVRTFFNPAGTITGRFSSSGNKIKGSGFVNTQQITRKYQYMFHSLSDKRVTFEIDYSTAELRAGCSIMRDKTMYKELMEGKDLHIESAKLTGIKDPNKEDRQKGKAVSFGLIFSMSAPSFQEYAYTNYGVVFTLKQARAIHKAYHTKYSGISKFQSWCWDEYKSTDMVTAMGRRNRCRLGTDASNYATQGSIAESTKWAVAFLARKYPESLKLIINVVHDAIYMDCKKKDFEKWSKRLEWAMLKGWEEICKSDLLFFKDIPMPTEVEVVG